MSNSNPYLIEGPALISFSGGRSSAYMLRQILDAHDGALPDDVLVAFANTGKERAETLRFVHECETRWAVQVHWLEWRSKLKRKPVAERFSQVGFNSAARNGEPFNALIASKKRVPNAVERSCTMHLKIQVLADFMASLGFDRWANVVGLRSDEMRRVAKLDDRNQAGAVPWLSAWPMARAGVTKADIWKFWLGGNADPKHLTSPLPQGFDLGLWPYEGNCDGCFLKARRVLTHLERDRPGMLTWWNEAEGSISGRFVTEYSYAELQADIERRPLLIPLDMRTLEYDAECGVGGVDHRIRCGGRP